MDNQYLLLIAVGFAAGFINTLAGGGSLLTLPLLIFMGLPPAVANGTNRIAIFLQTLTGAIGFKSKGVTSFPFSIYCGVSALVGSFIGAKIAIVMNPDSFKHILAVIMIVVGFIIILKPKFNAHELAERTTGKYLTLSVIVFFFLGIYGGFINAGIGFLMLLFLPYVNRLSLVKSNAVKVTVVCIYTVGALFMFYINGMIDIKTGFILAIGNMVGAWIASRWSVKKGDGAVKAVLLVALLIMAVKLLFFD